MLTQIKSIIFFLTSVFLYNQSHAQVACSSSAPFCANQGAVTFSASTNNGNAPAGPNYGCLGSQPNPAWYFFQVGQSGNIIIQINGTGSGDVDFVCWGPFANQNAACAGLTGNCTSCPSNVFSPNFYPSGNMVDCSYSANPNETCTIPNGIAGEFYMLLITNFSNQAQYINFSQTAGTGSTNCGLIGGATSQTICPNKTATLTASSSGLTNPTYQWLPGGATTATIVVSPATTAVYSVTISGLDGAGTATFVTNTGTVTVLPTPTIALTTNGNFCPGSTINLTASAGYTNYAWSGPPAYSQSTSVGLASITNATNTMAGTYTVLGTTAQGCTATATSTVGVVTTASVTASSFTVCQGGDVYLTANSLGASTYNWFGPSAFTSSVQNPTLTSVALNQAGIYTVRANFISGATTCTTSTTCTVNIIPATPAALNPISTVCSDGIVNLVAPNGGNSYVWSGPNSFTSTAQNPNIASASVINQGTYTVIITTSGCVNAGTVAVTVYNPLSFVTVPTGTAICLGLSSTLTSSATGGSGLYNYTWNPTTDLSAPTSSVTSVVGNNTTTYTLTLSDGNCPITHTQTTAVTVTVNPKPIITFSTSNARGCEPFCTDLISSSIPASNNCEWKFSRNLFESACNTPTFCFSQHGTYNATLTVTDINGCIDSTNQNAFITVDPKPSPDFTWTDPNPTILINEVTFTDKSTVGLPITKWSWSFGDNYILLGTDTSSLQNPIHLYNNVDNYLVSLAVTNSFGCIDTVKKYVKIEDEFAIYIPNAFSPHRTDGRNDEFKVAGMGFLSDSFEMAIYDRWGTLIYKTTDVYKGWDGTVKGGLLAKQDVYIYKIKLKDFKLRSKEYVGHITLL